MPSARLLYAIEGALNQRAPGLIQLLNVLCIGRYGKRCAELLLHEPEALVRLIKRLYGNGLSLNALLRSLVAEAVISLCPPRGPAPSPEDFIDAVLGRGRDTVMGLLEKCGAPTDP